MHNPERLPQTDTKQSNTGDEERYERLPCRGCLKSCRYYNECNGHPWRMGRQDGHEYLVDNA